MRERARVSTFYPTPAVRFPACPVDGAWLAVYPHSHAVCEYCDWHLFAMTPEGPG